MDANPPFELDNRSKRSVVLDVTTEDGRATALELIATADVFLTNIRPAALERVGLDPDTLLAEDERLVYALITGFGLEGPDADRAAYDIAAYWARSGIADLLTPPGDDPPFQRGGMGDHTVAMTGAAMVCAALLGRQATGRGPAGHHVVAPPGRLHGRLRPERVPDVGAGDRHRSTPDHGQSGDEQLRGGGRQAVLDRRPRGRTALATAGPRRRAPGMARRPRVLDPAAAASSTPPS